MRFEPPSPEEYAERLAAVLARRVPRLQRGLPGQRTRHAATAGAGPGGARPGPPARRPRTRGTGGGRAGRPAGAARGARRDPVRRVGAAGAAGGAGPRPVEPAAHRRRGRRLRAATALRPARAVPGPGRRSRPRTRWPRRSTTPTGPRCGASTTCCTSWRPARSCCSTGRWRPGTPTARRRRWPRWTRWPHGLGEYRLLHAARAELLRALGRTDEARTALDRALALATNPAERDLLSRRCRGERAAQCSMTGRTSTLVDPRMGQVAAMATASSMSSASRNDDPADDLLELQVRPVGDHLSTRRRRPGSSSPCVDRVELRAAVRRSCPPSPTARMNAQHLGHRVGAARPWPRSIVESHSSSTPLISIAKRIGSSSGRCGRRCAHSTSSRMSGARLDIGGGRTCTVVAWRRSTGRSWPR